MGASKSQTWIAGTVLVALVVLAATWFLLVSPKRTATQDARDANASALSEQDQLRSQLALLKTQYANLDEYQTQLDAIATQIPSEPKLSDYVRSLAAVALQYGVTITELDPGTAMPYAEALGETAAALATPTSTTATDGSTTNPVATAQATASTAATASAASAGETTGGSTDSTAAGTTAATTTPAPTETATTSGLFAVPVAVTVLGTYSNVNAFLDTIQNQVDRLFLVSTLSAVRQDAADNAGTGRPPTAPGDVELTINGFLFEYLDAPTAVTDQTGTEDQPAEPTPLPASDRNPFGSITG